MHLELMPNKILWINKWCWNQEQFRQDALVLEEACWMGIDKGLWYGLIRVTLLPCCWLQGSMPGEILWCTWLGWTRRRRSWSERCCRNWKKSNLMIEHERRFTCINLVDFFCRWNGHVKFLGSCMEAWTAKGRWRMLRFWLQMWTASISALLFLFFYFCKNACVFWDEADNARHNFFQVLQWLATQRSNKIRFDQANCSGPIWHSLQDHMD